jgi:2-keto-4-pentenoate hydratase
MREISERPFVIGDRGRAIHGPTQPGAFIPCARVSDLSRPEVAEVAESIAAGRVQKRTIELPDRLRTRSWDSVAAVVLALEQRLPWDGAGWKVGAASPDVREAEGVPSPSPGRIFRRGVFPSGSRLPAELFINYRLCESEFAFELSLDFPARERPYTEHDARAGIAALFPAIEIGDSVFADWYAASGYFGTSLDNGGGAAFVEGTRVEDWEGIDLPDAPMHLYLNGQFVKSGRGRAAMGHPVTSLTWLINWLRERGRGTIAGEVVSTGTCTGHCFVAPGDHVSVDFGGLGVVEAYFE